jgi:hypothetical protein
MDGMGYGGSGQAQAHMSQARPGAGHVLSQGLEEVPQGREAGHAGHGARRGRGQGLGGCTAPDPTAHSETPRERAGVASDSFASYQGAQTMSPKPNCAGGKQDLSFNSVTSSTCVCEVVVGWGG